MWSELAEFREIGFARIFIPLRRRHLVVRRRVRFHECRAHP